MEGLHDYEDSTDGLRGALIASMERRGVVASIKAKIRAEVHASLHNETVSPPDSKALPGDVYIAGEILKDFLVRMKCENTLSVLSKELGIDSEHDLQREFLLQELGMKSIPGQADIPVLLLLIDQSMNRRAEKTDESANS